MQKYSASRKVVESSYAGLKADQARALFLIAEAGKEGITDEALSGFDENGNVVAVGTGIKVKTALLRTGYVQSETIAGERKGSERTYAYTGLALADDLSPALKRIGAAVAVLGTGTKSQFAEQLVKASQAESDAAVAAGLPEGTEAPAVLTIEQATKNVNGVWLRLQDRGIIQPVKKGGAAPATPAAEAAPADTGTTPAAEAGATE